MKYDSALDKLYSLQKFGIKLGLNNISEFLKLLGNPQNKFKSFHIAGTNGKGSTASFISSILMEEGYKTALYTSPHYVRFNERIRINGIEIDDKYLVDFINEFDDYITEKKLTFFEVTTAIAFKYFEENKVDYAVIETGMGGRLDATNTLNPVASVITSISLDHTHILGENLTDIAAEKAGIIKRNSKIFLGEIPLEAKKKIYEIAGSQNSKVYEIADFITANGDKLDFISGQIIVNNINPPLIGQHQKYNALLAILTLSKSIIINNINSLQKGIQRVVQNTGIQGRYEIYNYEPKVIFDSAHNPDGIRTFLNSFNKEAEIYKNRVLLLGGMKDKAFEDMLTDLKNYFNEFHFTSINNERSLNEQDFKLLSHRLNIQFQFENTPHQFIIEFIKERKNECLVVLGSIYVLGKIKEELNKKQLDNFEQ